LETVITLTPRSRAMSFRVTPIEDSSMQLV